MSDMVISSSFKIGKLYICRNPFPAFHDTWYWALFSDINCWDEKPRKLYERETFMVLDIFTDIGSNDCPEYWIKILTHAGVAGWFKYSSAFYAEEDVVEEIKSC